jgi:hypothetical protein
MRAACRGIWQCDIDATLRRRNEQRQAAAHEIPEANDDLALQA